MAKVSVQILTWNSIKYIGDCLASLAKQSFEDFSVMVVDNGSSDGTVEFVRVNYPTVSVLQNFKNLGYAKGNNQGIKLAKSIYVLVINPDVILESDYLKKMVNFADQHPEAGSFGGKILKLYTQAYDKNDQAGLRQSIKSDVIDSTGLEIYRSRKAVDRGEGQKDEGQYNSTQEVFGITGAAVMYRKSALEETAVNGQYFDNDFFAYKEDVDLAWRLRLYGFSSWYVPVAVCYHHRRLSADASAHGLKKITKHRKQVSKILRSISLKNHHLLIIKNDQWSNLFYNLPWFLGREIPMIGYSFLLEFFQWKTFFTFLKQLPSAIRKRRIIMSHRKVSTQEIRKWFK
ncbi:MAG: glycosyltransferase [Candidatus Buchananbacteria bacterium]|nr:glycosyltransferase [Candidatus Buchananbacteria bacterium]